MNILVLSFYFRPDLSAGSFRNTALVGELEKQLPADARIDVVTTLPNRYKSFDAEAPRDERQGRVVVHRIELPGHSSGMLDQSRAFVSFWRQAMARVAGRRYDLVYASSSRLMTAVLGAWVSKRQRAPLYLDIRDIFVDTIKDVLPAHLALPVKPLFSLLERWAMRSASRVNLVSGGFRAYFEERYPGLRLSFFSNGIDDEFLQHDYTRPAGFAADQDGLRVLYAGNMGEGQGLHAIVPELARRMSDRLHFRIIGGGGREQALRQALADAGVDNVTILPPVDRARLLTEYAQADVLFMHLNDYSAFEKVLPSKIFEYAATGKPVWAGVAGFAAEFVRDEVSNAAVFAPCDAAAAEQAFARLEPGEVVREAFVGKYARRNISRALAADILALLPGAPS